MSNVERLGLGVMIRMLGGNSETVDAMLSAAGKTISHVALIGDSLLFTFDDGATLRMLDNGQSCCETRYMRTDDDLPYYVGATLMDAEIRPAPSVEDEHGEQHDVEFLIITTSKGVFTMASHNEHNGYYGGFSIEASYTGPEGKS